MDSFRFFDILFSLMGAILLSPFFIIIAILIILTSKGPIFYKQIRVGKNGQDFKLYKFRSMKINADKNGLLTVGGRDSRITPLGYFLRKFKLDEMPQLINVLWGEMSIVGPRPEVRKYVNLYSDEQKVVLTVLPGITDYASIAFRNENELLEKAESPEDFYINEVMPYKILLNLQFIKNRNLPSYFSIIWKTALTSLRGK